MNTTVSSRHLRIDCVRLVQKMSLKIFSRTRRMRIKRIEFLKKTNNFFFLMQY